MLPPPPLTDPDEQVSRIRFFTREFRQRPCSDERYLAPPPRQVGYPSSLCGQVCGVQCPLPCFRPTVLSPWRLPSLHRVPVSPGSPTSRGPMKALRLPARAFPVPYGFGSGLHMLPRLRVRRSAPGAAGGRLRTWALWSAGMPLSGSLHMGTHGISQVSWRSLPYLCPALRPRPDRQDLAICSPVDAAPGPNTPKAPART